MPLDGNDVASKPAGTTAVSGTTIESSKFNSVVNDIYAIFNTARSIAKGFTGASSAQGALDNFFDGSSYVKASKMLIADDTDTSKKLKFDLSGFTTAQTRTLTPPNYNGTIATLAGTENLTNKTLTSPTISTSISLPAGAIDALTEIAAGLKTGADAKLVTGTKGTSGNIVEWNADGDAVDSGVAAADIVVGNDIADMLETGDIGVSVQGYDADTLKADADDVLSAGYAATAANDGTKSSGSYTPTYVGGNMRRIVNGGAFTLNPPSASGDYTLVIQMTNNASAGAITDGGFNAYDDSELTTTDGDDFFCYITKCNGFTLALWRALQ